jgi:hypothetical protein
MRKKINLNQLVLFFMRSNTLLLLRPIALVLFITTVLTACANSSSIPLSIPFPLDKAGKLETDVYIAEPDNYAFDIDFMYEVGNWDDARRVSKLAGSGGRYRMGELSEPGIPLQLRLRITRIRDKTESIEFDEISTAQGTYAGGFGKHSKSIKNIPLNEGHYKVLIENLLAVPELVGTKTIFNISHAHRAK